MEKCNCWEEKEIIMGYYLDWPVKKVKQICNGTKEREACDCNGDVSKCNFYPDKRKEKTMCTLDMMIEAKENGKTYICCESLCPVMYNSTLGFHDKDGDPYYTGDDFCNINELFSINDWHVFLNSENVMTKSEAEAKFNIKIIGE